MGNRADTCGNVGVVGKAGEAFGAAAYGIHGHRIARVACCGEAYAYGLVEYAEHFHCECVEVGVEGVLVGAVAQRECGVELRAQRCRVAVVHGHRAEESQVVAQVLLHVVPAVGGVVVEQRLAVFAELFLAHLLVVDVAQAGA